MDPKTDIGQIGAVRIRAPTPAKDGGRKIGNRPPFHKIMQETSAAKAPANLRPKTEIERKIRDPETPEGPPSISAAGYAPLTVLLASPVAGDVAKTAPPLNPEIPPEIAEDPKRADRHQGETRESGQAEMKSAVHRKPTEAKAETLQPDRAEPSIKATAAFHRDDRKPANKNDGGVERLSPLPAREQLETITSHSHRDSNVTATVPTKPSDQKPEAVVNMMRETTDDKQLPATALDRPVKKAVRVEVSHASRDDRPAAIAEERTGKSKQQAGDEQKDGRAHSPQMPAAKTDAMERGLPPSAMVLDAGNGLSPGRQIANFVDDLVSSPLLPGDPQRQQISRDGPLKTLELVLHPETIGQVRVSLQLRGKTLELRIEAKSVEAANAIEQDRSLLGQLLNQAGFQLSVADIKVDVRMQAQELPVHEQGAFLPDGHASEGDHGPSGRQRDVQAALPGSEIRSNSGDNSLSVDRVGGIRGGIYI